MWALSDPGTFPAPANTPSAFNSALFATTVLNAQLLEATNFRVGIADIRGDGRPDYRYHARLLYGDHITPTRVSVAGGTALAIAGFGFQANTRVTIGSGNAQPLAASANQILVMASAHADGVQDMTLTDPPTLANSILSGVVTFGAGPNDILRLTAGANPPTAVGEQAPNPVRVQVVAPDGITPVAGASIFFTSSPAVAFAACSGGGSCTVLTDQSGQASSLVSVLTAGTITMTARLAPASYTSPQQVQTTLLATESSLDLSVLSPYVWIAQGATFNIALNARVLSNGVPIKGRTVNYYLVKGSATLSPPNSKTNANGYASSTLRISSLAGDVQVSVCVEPGDVPCQTFYGTAVPASSLRLQAVAGDLQLITVGPAFQPVTIRVTDMSVPPDPVIGVSVLFQSLLGRTTNDAPIVSGGDTTITRNPMPIILGTSQASVISDANGLASMQPSTGGFQGALAILGTVTAGPGNLPFQLQSLWPMSD
jgi:IPT/TIG domain